MPVKQSSASAVVLLVEDDADVRQAMAELLREEGFECIVAEHGAAALEVLGRQVPSLLLVDLLMPVMNGLDLIDRVRCDARWSDLPIVVMTAAVDRLVGVELESLHLPVLSKPVDIATLMHALARYSNANANGDAPAGP